MKIQPSCTQKCTLFALQSLEDRYSFVSVCIVYSFLDDVKLLLLVIFFFFVKEKNDCNPGKMKIEQETFLLLFINI